MQYRAVAVFDDLHLDRARRTSPLLDPDDEKRAFYPGLGLRPPLAEYLKRFLLYREGSAFSAPREDEADGPRPRRKATLASMLTGLSDQWGAPSGDVRERALTDARSRASRRAEWDRHLEGRERAALKAPRGKRAKDAPRRKSR